MILNKDYIIPLAVNCTTWEFCSA